jgi:hypothetical protein
MAELHVFTCIYEIHGGGYVVLCYSQPDNNVMTSPVDYHTALAPDNAHANEVARSMQKALEKAIAARGDRLVTSERKETRVVR